MVPNESQRTHIHFDGLGDVFRALALENIAREVERRQRPDGGNAISTKVGSGLSWNLLMIPDGIGEGSHP